MDTLQTQLVQSQGGNSLPSIGWLFSFAFRTIFLHPLLFLRIMGLPFLFMFLLVVEGIFGFITPQGGFSALYPLSFLLLFVLAVVFLWSQLAVIQAISSRCTFGALRSYKETGGKIHSCFWITLLASLAMFGGYILLIIPGIVLAFYFVFATYALVVDRTKGVSALLRSMQYVRGHWWGVFGRLLLLSLVLVVVMLAIQFGLENIGKAIGGWIGVAIAVGTLQFLATIFFTPFSLAFVFGMYDCLRRGREEEAFQPGKKKIVLGAVILGVLGVVLIPVVLFFVFRDFIGTFSWNFGGVDSGFLKEFPSEGGVSEVVLQERDLTRISDLNALSRALGILVMAVPQGETFCVDPGVTYTSLKNVDISDWNWFPVDPTLVTGVAGGSLFRWQPFDPVNDNGFFYTFMCNRENEYELSASLESRMYSLGGERNLTSTDRGSDAKTYEVGSNLNLIP